MIYSDATIDTLCEAWDNGLDYIGIQGLAFGTFPDGIWEIYNSCVILDDTAKINFVYKPSSKWGCKVD